MKLRALILWLAFVAFAFAEAPVWQPERTWVFAVGILKFEGAALHGWPEKGRVDEIMLDALRRRGVPDDHIVFLKNEQATSAQIQERFTRFLQRPTAGDTLIFYYAGHGGRDYESPARPVHLVPYDSKVPWPTAAVLDAIERNFKGSQVLLTADCCHSGGLGEEASRHDSGRISYGTLTSARASATSTGNWTFTQCLADLFRGEARLDLNHDGVITFAEAGQYSDLKMAFRESQRATHTVAGKFSWDLVLAKARSAAPERVGEVCEGRWEGKWYKAEIIAARDGKYQVTWPGWDKSYDSWLGPQDLRPAPQKVYPDGASVEIEWSKKWYPGSIVRSELGLFLVHYEGYTAADDEWVPLDRLRARK